VYHTPTQVYVEQNVQKREVKWQFFIPEIAEADVLQLLSDGRMDKQNCRQTEFYSACIVSNADALY